MAERLNELRSEVETHRTFAHQDETNPTHSADTQTPTEPPNPDRAGDPRPDDVLPGSAPDGAEQPLGRSDWSDLAQSTDTVSEPAIHQESVDPDTAQRYLAEEQPYLTETNRDRLLEGRPGYGQNCTHCVLTLDRQLDGLDVNATGRPALDGAWDVLLDGLPDGTWHNSQSYDNAIRSVNGASSGSRGVVYIARPNGTAHVFNVINTPDGVVFLDGQTGSLAILESKVTTIQLYLYR